MPTLHGSIRRLVREEPEGESLSLTPAPVYFSLKMSRVSASGRCSGPRPAALHSPASLIADNNWEESHRPGLSHWVRRAAHSQSCLRASGVEAGAVLVESRGSCGGPAPVSPQPPA